MNNPQPDKWRALYDWLGEQARDGYREARENEQAANLDKSAGPAYMADAFREVRAEMRRVDPNLPRAQRKATS